MYAWLRKFVSENRLAVMVFGALVVAFIMTSISLGLYVSSGASKLDLSRPGYEKVRTEITVDSKDDQPFSSTGELDQAAKDEFTKKFDKQRGELNKLNDFGGDVLSDESMGITKSADGSSQQ